MSFQSVLDGHNGQNQSGGYGNPAPQRGYGFAQQSSPWAAQPPQHPSSPTYGVEFAHHHTHDADPFVAASSQVAIDIETLSLNYREVRDALNDINTPKDTVEFRNAVYVQFTRLVDTKEARGCTKSLRKLWSTSARTTHSER